MKITIVSDVHINSHFSNECEFIEFIKNLKTDCLILNGDIYDLYLKKDYILLDVFRLIESNKNIGNYVYLKGNHDQDIENYFNIKVLDKFEIDNIVITHGNLNDISSCFGFDKYIVKIRNWLECKLDINLKVILFKCFGFILTPLMIRGQNKFKEIYPDKTLILAHIHKPYLNGIINNCGCWTDGTCSYIELNTDISSISLKYFI